MTVARSEADGGRYHRNPGVAQGPGPRLLLEPGDLYPFPRRCAAHGLPRRHHPRFSKETLVKRTFQPNTKKRAKTHGFRHRMSTSAGRAILKARRRKGRHRLSA